MTISANEDGWVRPVAEDVCERCGQPFKSGDAVQSVGPACGTIDDQGRLRRVWAHPACVNPPQVERATVAPPRHRDPVVADLLDRVDRLEARKR